MKRLYGDTYPQRHLLRGLGAQYDAIKKCWEVPDDKYDEAKALVGRHTVGRLTSTKPNLQGPLFTPPLPQYVTGCLTCADIRDKHAGFGPSHRGSKICQSGSIASGGTKSHCTCDRCF